MNEKTTFEELCFHFESKNAKLSLRPPRQGENNTYSHCIASWVPDSVFSFYLHLEIGLNEAELILRVTQNTLTGPPKADVLYKIVMPPLKPNKKLK